MRPLIRPIPLRMEQPKTFAEARVNGGMVTSIDPADLENSQLVIAKNSSVRFDRITRRLGTKLFVPAKPDSLKVLNFFAFSRFDGSVNLVRFTPTTVNRATTLAWIPIVGTLTGGVNDRFSIAVLNDRLFFANGIDEVQELNVSANTFADAGNAPKYKYITGFG